MKYFVTYWDVNDDVRTSRLYLTGDMDSLDNFLQEDANILCIGVSKTEAQARITQNLLAYSAVEDSASN